MLNCVFFIIVDKHLCQLNYGHCESGQIELNEDRLSQSQNPENRKQEMQNQKSRQMYCSA